MYIKKLKCVPFDKEFPLTKICPGEHYHGCAQRVKIKITDFIMASNREELEGEGSNSTELI